MLWFHSERELHRSRDPQVQPRRLPPLPRHRRRGLQGDCGADALPLRQGILILNCMMIDYLIDEIIILLLNDQ